MTSGAILVLGVAACAIGLLLRSVPLMKANWVGIDTFAHFVLSEDMRTSGNRTPGTAHFFFTSEYTYPPLLHILLSRFPREKHRKLQWLGPILDTISGIFVWLASFILLGIEWSFVALALYWTYPILIDSAWTVGSRVLANLFLVALLSLDFLVVEGFVSHLWIVLEAVLVALLAMTHRLYMQVLFAVAISEFLITGFAPLLLAAALGVGPLLLLKSFRNVVRGHFVGLREIAAFRGDKTASQEVRSRKSTIRQFVGGAPSIIIIFPVAILGGLPFGSLGTLCLGISLGVLLISTLWPLGQGYRHLVGGAVPCSIGLAYFGSISSLGPTAVASVIAVQIVLQCVKTYLTISPSSTYLVPGDLIDCLRTASQQKSDPANQILLVVPIDFSYAAAYFSDFKVLIGSGAEGVSWSLNHRLRLELKQYGLAGVIEKYGVAVVVLNEKDIPNPLPRGFSVSCSCGHYIALQRRSI